MNTSLEESIEQRKTPIAIMHRNLVEKLDGLRDEVERQRNGIVQSGVGSTIGLSMILGRLGEVASADIVYQQYLASLRGFEQGIEETAKSIRESLTK